MLQYRKNKNVSRLFALSAEKFWCKNTSMTVGLRMRSAQNNTKCRVDRYEEIFKKKKQDGGPKTKTWQGA